MCHTRATALRAKKRNSSRQVGPNPLYLSPGPSIHSNLHVQLLLQPDSIDFGSPIQPPPPPIQATLETHPEPP